MEIYLDNAATTPLDPEVFEAMKPYMIENFGNPSSTHAHGRKAKSAIESARKKVAELIHCTPGEIIFTSGGTEADNTLITSAIQTFGIRHIITSSLEHHAVKHTCEALEKAGDIELHYADVDANGHVQYEKLQALLSIYPNSLVTLMHGNNEIGNLLDMKRVGELCAEATAYFHSDAVQTMGHYFFDMRLLDVHGMAASAHKFHGPKGVGFMYINKNKKLSPLIHGGNQERSMRGGTENVYGIVGLAKALEVAHRNMTQDERHIKSLKERMIEKLKQNIPDIAFNGDSENPDGSLYTVLSASLPENNETDMVHFNLDLRGISCSAGSACSSGALAGSHVLQAIYPDSKRVAIRFSFSKYNSFEEIDNTVSQLAEICKISV